MQLEAVKTAAATFIASMRMCIKRGRGCYCAHAHETPNPGSATGTGLWTETWTHYCKTHFQAFSLGAVLGLGTTQQFKLMISPRVKIFFCFPAFDTISVHYWLPPPPPPPPPTLGGSISPCHIHVVIVTHDGNNTVT